MQYEELFFNEDQRYEKPYELYIVTRDGIRRRMDIRSQRKLSAVYELEMCHRIDVEFPMIADFVPIKESFN